MTPDDYRDRIKDLQEQQTELLEVLGAAETAELSFSADDVFRDYLTNTCSGIADLIYENLDLQGSCRYEIKRLERFMS